MAEEAKSLKQGEYLERIPGQDNKPLKIFEHSSLTLVQGMPAFLDEGPMVNSQDYIIGSSSSTHLDGVTGDFFDNGKIIKNQVAREKVDFLSMPPNYTNGWRHWRPVNTNIEENAPSINSYILNLSPIDLARFIEDVYDKEPRTVALIPYIYQEDKHVYNLLEFLFENSEYDISNQSAIQCLLSYIIEKYSNKELTLQPIKGRLSSTKVKIIDHYIRDNITEKVTMNELAQLLNMSRSHFEHTFKKSTAETPIAYRNRLKVETAKIWLATSSKSIDDIAHSLGFDTGYFIRLFHKLTRQTPAIYRQNNF